MSRFLSDFNHNKNIAKSMREVCLFSGTTKPKLSFSKDLDHCQKALYKMDDIDRSSTSHNKTPWLKKNNYDLKFALLIIILVRPSCNTGEFLFSFHTRRLPWWNMEKITCTHLTLARRIPHIYIILSYSNCWNFVIKIVRKIYVKVNWSNQHPFVI